MGGLFWGVYADRYGRRRGAGVDRGADGLGTLADRLAPTYAAVGMAAPALIVLAPAVQGFAVSGEFASATAMLVELAPPGRPRVLRQHADGAQV